MTETTHTDRTALLVVDMQNVVIKPSGASAVAGADPVVDAVNARVASAVDQGCRSSTPATWPPPIYHRATPRARPDSIRDSTCAAP